MYNAGKEIQDNTNIPYVYTRTFVDNAWGADSSSHVSISQRSRKTLIMWILQHGLPYYLKALSMACWVSATDEYNSINVYCSRFLVSQKQPVHNEDSRMHKNLGGSCVQEPSLSWRLHSSATTISCDLQDAVNIALKEFSKPISYDVQMLPPFRRWHNTIKQVICTSWHSHPISGLLRPSFSLCPYIPASLGKLLAKHVPGRVIKIN